MVELKVHPPSPGMTPSRRRDRYSRDKSLLRKREQSKLEDWANMKCMSFSKNKCKALHVGWNKPQQRPRLGSHSLRCAFGSAGGQKAEHKSAAVSQQQRGQPLSWAVSVKARSPHQGMPWLHSATPRTLGSPGSSPTLRDTGKLERAMEGHQAKEVVGKLEAWGQAEGMGFAQPKEMEVWRIWSNLWYLKASYGEGRDALFTRINGDGTRGNRHKYLQEEIHTGIRKNSSPQEFNVATDCTEKWENPLNSSCTL